MSDFNIVATLISNPAKPGLSPALLQKAAEALPGLRRSVTLHEGVAADLIFSPTDVQDASASLRAALADAPVDIIIQPVAQRRKHLFLADMDSTMIGQECIDELADLVGVKAHVSAITERAMRGEIDFEPALRERVALLKGLSADVVQRVIDERITLTPGGKVLVHTMRASGAYTALVSGGFTLFTGTIGPMIGFHEHRSNLLEIENGLFAGTVAEPILGKEAKLSTLIELRTRFALEKHATLAVGDGANDLAMLGEAGLGVAFYAKPKVAQFAHARIDHSDLTALLYAQGYRFAEFVN
jgi:phosphoserine phosphatase